MIKHLYIRNFVLIDELDLDFREGFSAFTGETGAGKSILIDAISLLRAERASTSLIRKGAEKAIIEGTFDLARDSHARAVLEEAGFEVEEETTFTRELHRNGKSTARIDHRTVTLSLMKEVLRFEIDIHGQRDNAYLLDKSIHVSLLDRYINQPAETEEMQKAYRNYAALVKEKENILKTEYNENDLDYFQYQIREIEAADLHVGEDEELEKKEKSYKAVRDSLEKLGSIHELYDEHIAASFYELNRLVQSLKADEQIEKIQTAVNDSYYALNDAMETLQGLTDSQEMSEEDINAMEERLYTIQKLKRKYGSGIEDILAYKEDLQKKVSAFSNRQAVLKEMDQKISDARKQYEEKAVKLSEERQKYARQLDKDVQQNLKDLMLDQARFQTVFKEEKKPTAHGRDDVEFMISMNKGMDLSPLNKTASGGELSRLMLGLKCIFTRLQGIQTVIFDEIDTGVSGPVASAIGEKMHGLSKECQVFAVTHLAQVAACADHHYLVVKKSDEDSTVSTVRQLNEEERIDALALIASGSITETSREAAREMFERSRH